MRMKKFLFLVVLMWCSSVWAQINPLSTGISSFENGKYQDALASFRDIILTSSLEGFHSDAYFWIAKCFIATRDYEQAEKNIDFFLVNFPEHPLYPEGYYQKGRLLFLQKQFESSIQALYGFTENYPDNPYVANAFFWIGESLFELGHFDDAHKVFTMIVQRYPRSFKVEAAGYRISLIEFKYRENELLKLIKISHEEYLNALDEFDQREKSYEKAIREYQQRLNTVMSADFQSQMESLSAEVRLLTAKNNQLNERLAQLASENEQLSSGIDDTPGAQERSSEIRITGDTDANKLLAIKARALDMKDFLLNQMEKEMQAAP